MDNIIIDNLDKSTHFINKLISNCDEIQFKLDIGLGKNLLDPANNSLNEKDKEYLELYYKFLNEDYHDDSLGNLNDLLIEVIKKCEKKWEESLDLAFLCQSMLKQGDQSSKIDCGNPHDKDRTNLISRLFPLFKKAVEKGLQDNVIMACKFEMNLFNAPEIIPEMVEAFIFPKEYYQKNRMAYYHIFKSMVIHYFIWEDLSSDFNTIVTPEMRMMMDVCREKLKEIKIINLANMKLGTLLQTYYSGIIALYYRGGLGLSLIPEIFSYIYNHVYELEDFINLYYRDDINNNIRYQYMEMILCKIIDAINGKRPIIR